MPADADATPLLSPPQQRLRRWVLGSWALLCGLVATRQWQQAPLISGLGWALLFTAPLWLALPGLWRGRRYTHQWATLCVLPYFVVGVTEGVANSALRGWALSMLGASLLWFFALLAFIRVSPRELPPANQTTS